jgi:hypothetical protein
MGRRHRYRQGMKRSRSKVGYSASQEAAWEEIVLNRALEKGKDAQQLMVQANRKHGRNLL